jgi:NADH:ubiquinone oxidoreductase subunit 4 (subunit M)
MYQSTNSRGGIEAILFFAGWAVLGSFLVSMGFIYLVCLCQSCNFNEIFWFNFAADEMYYLYILFFFGFGTKLST